MATFGRSVNWSNCSSTECGDGREREIRYVLPIGRPARRPVLSFASRLSPYSTPVHAVDLHVAQQVRIHLVVTITRRQPRFGVIASRPIRRISLWTLFAVDLLPHVQVQPFDTRREP